MAARKLGEILVAGQRVSPADLKKALDAQLIFGGRLGTNLLDLGLLDEQSLIEALEEQKQVAVATPRMFEEASGDALRLVSAALASRHRIIPLALEDRKLKVAMLDPLDLIAIDELAFATGCTVIPYLAPEIRLLYWLERYYGIERPTRFIRLSEDTPAHEPSEGGIGESVAAKSSGAATADPVRQEVADLQLEDVLGLARGAVVTPQSLRSKSASPQAVDAVVEELVRRSADQRRRAEAARGPVTLADTAALLAEAQSRDDIGDALVALARARFARVMTWLIQKDRALGWMGSIDGLAPENARRIARAAMMSLTEPSVLSEVVSSAQYHLGELPASPGNERLGGFLGAPRPESVLFIPVHLGDQVVLVLQCDDAERPLGEFDLRSLRVACQKAGLAMEVLLLRSRIRQI